MIAPLPGLTETKPGSATLPLPGIEAAIFDKDGNEIEEGGGTLVITKPWPGMARTLYKEDDRFIETYWDRYGKDTYLVGDAARRDEDGFFWIVGRIDDVINVSGHRLSTMEVESALVSNERVAEAAVIAVPDEDTGQAIIAFVTPEGTEKGSDDMAKELREHVAEQDRQARPAQGDPLRRRPAQDPLGEDHAPPVARHRHRQGRPGRHDHPPGPRDRRGAPGASGGVEEGASRRFATPPRPRASPAGRSRRLPRSPGPPGRRPS